MAICPKCRTAYLDGESHRCDPKGSGIIGTLVGALAGAGCGVLLVIFADVVFHSDGWAYGAFYLGVPFGAIVGALIGAYGRRA
jgi:hypothetical protein